ncbi:MAG: aldo/keto reductase [Lachnospiraceae bacterium]|nr:aldo/keto reductase [Lachnospiraceae bacterium]
MNYRENQKNGEKLSILGYGCMRFSHKGPGIDKEKTEKEILAAIDAGVNYFDTAYIYPGSEAVLGEILHKNGLRDRVKIATKLPHYLIKKPEDMDRYFNEQLTRLKTDHIDYYLMHFLTSVETWQRLCDMGIDAWLSQKKAEGKVANVGFSFHGDTVNFNRIIDSYDWDFCQIQFNYMDERTQAGIDGLNHAHEKGIPVVIMEPLRGGRLADKLPKSAKAEFAKADPDRSPAEWALRWLWDHEQVNVVLSGMNDIAQINENCRIASQAQAGELTDRDQEVFRRVIAKINNNMKVGCTGCGYCQPCPQGVAIPTIFSLYNESFGEQGYIRALADYAMCTALRKKSSNAGMCTGCGKCEQHCPQGLHIRDELKNAAKRFETPLYKVGSKVLLKFFRQ